ncbi:MAG: glycosyltransferase [Betaproteobacteria bacterium]|nr:glycosyltransferase [Betaproteobacteria bacterium]
MSRGTLSSGLGVVVATYNRPAALSWVLAGLFNQRVRPAVICIADDGSGEDTRGVIKKWQGFYAEHSLTRLQHVWQPDQGFRLAKIRNLAVSKMQEHRNIDRIIFLDGDCIPRPTFVGSHQELLGQKESRICVAGGRVLLSQSLTAKLERYVAQRAVPDLQREAENVIGRLWLQFFSGQLDRVLPLLGLPDGSWRLRGSSDYRVLRGCNFSMYLSHYQEVGGCSEDFVGWGLEDSDLAIRLITSGVRLKSGRCATNVFHMWHAEADRSKLLEHEARLRALLHKHGLPH